MYPILRPIKLKNKERNFFRAWFLAQIVANRTIIDEIMVVQKQDMQKHVRIPETTCTF